MDVFTIATLGISCASLMTALYITLSSKKTLEAEREAASARQTELEAQLQNMTDLAASAQSQTEEVLQARAELIAHEKLETVKQRLTYNELQHERAINRLKEEHQATLEREIAETKKRSKRQSYASNFGNDMQHFLPFMIADKYDMNLKDIQFVGGTADAIMFDGLNDDEVDDVTIRIIDFKTSNEMSRCINGRSKAARGMVTYDPFHKFVKSKRQRKILQAVAAGRVTFEVWGMDSTTHEFDRFEQGTPTLFHYNARVAK